METALKSTLKNHIEAVHERIKPFKCNICHFEFAHKGDLKKHTDFVHEGIKLFKCHLCDYKAARKNTLKTHIESVHEGIKPFKCKECDYEAAYKSSLKKHMESVHKGIERFKCNMNEDCDGVNNPVKMELSELDNVLDPQDRKERLFQYIITDSETGLEACSFCQKIYQGPDPSTRQRKLMDHIDSVHLKVRSYKCQFCDKKYACKSQLCTHLKLKHLTVQTKSKFVNEKKKSENKNKDQDASFQSIKVEQISVDVDPLLFHEIKEEIFEENEAMPIEDLTEVYIKQEEFGAPGYQYEQENGMIVQEIKEEFVLGE